MTHPWIVLTLAIATFCLRASGLNLGRVHIPAGLELAWRYVPVALLAALISISLASHGSGESSIRGLAVVGAGLVTFRYRQLWVCIFSGMVFYLSLQAVV